MGKEGGEGQTGGKEEKRRLGRIEDPNKLANPRQDTTGWDNTEREGGVLCIIRIVLYYCINTVVLFLRIIRGAGRNVIGGRLSPLLLRSGGSRAHSVLKPELLELRLNLHH